MIKHFASANSYNGFYSLFGDIFKSSKFDKVFVLKGGPGTGKSTLIKKVAQFVKDAGGEYRLYHCSSDIKSLDGVTMSLHGRRFAVIDGTSPHERDAIYVGVTDELINLSEGIDLDWIKSYKDDIIDLSSQKSYAYKVAYSYLKIAGQCQNELCQKSSERLAKNLDIRDLLDQSIFEVETKNHDAESYFISSFNKHGYTTSNVPVDEYDKVIKIGGNETNAKVIFGFIVNHCQKFITTLFPSPLNPMLYEGVVIDNKTLLIFNNSSPDLNSNNYFSKKIIDAEETKLMQNVHDEFLCEAARWLSIASDIHFRLEDIYVKCTNFDHNQVVFDKICKKILKVCEYDD